MMNRWSRLCIILFFLSILGASIVHAKTARKALSVDGFYVDLYDDFSWKYSHEYKRPINAQTYIKTPIQDFSIWVDDSIWRTVESDIQDQLEFDHISGDAFVIIVTDASGPELAALKHLSVDEIRQVFSDVEVLMDEERIVNGVQVGCLDMLAYNGETEYRFFSYFFSHESKGMIKVIAFSEEGTFDSISPDVFDLLNGLVIN